MLNSTSKRTIGVVAVDPTILNTRERLTAFLESMICKEGTVFLPSLISSFIQKRKWDELVGLLRGWEWNLDKSKSERWFESRDFKSLCHRLNAVCLSFERIREELGAEERELLSRVLDTIGYESPSLIELAKELLAIAVTKKGRIVSYTRHLKRWLKSLRKVLILEISEKTNALAQVKADIKSRIRRAGWKGRVFVTSLTMITALALVWALPPLVNWALDTVIAELGEGIIVGVITNGV